MVSALYSGFICVETSAIHFECCALALLPSTARSGSRRRTGGPVHVTRRHKFTPATALACFMGNVHSEYPREGTGLQCGACTGPSIHAAPMKASASISEVAASSGTVPPYTVVIEPGLSRSNAASPNSLNSLISVLAAHASNGNPQASSSDNLSTEMHTCSGSSNISTDTDTVHDGPASSGSSSSSRRPRPGSPSPGSWNIAADNPLQLIQHLDGRLLKVHLHLSSIAEQQSHDLQQLLQGRDRPLRVWSLEELQLVLELLALIQATRNKAGACLEFLQAYEDAQASYHVSGVTAHVRRTPAGRTAATQRDPRRHASAGGAGSRSSSVTFSPSVTFIRPVSVSAPGAVEHVVPSNGGVSPLDRSNRISRASSNVSLTSTCSFNSVTSDTSSSGGFWSSAAPSRTASIRCDDDACEADAAAADSGVTAHLATQAGSAVGQGRAGAAAVQKPDDRSSNSSSSSSSWSRAVEKPGALGSKGATISTMSSAASGGTYCLYGGNKPVMPTAASLGNGVTAASDTISSILSSTQQLWSRDVGCHVAHVSEAERAGLVVIKQKTSATYCSSSAVKNSAGDDSTTASAAFAPSEGAYAGDAACRTSEDDVDNSMQRVSSSEGGEVLIPGMRTSSGSSSGYGAAATDGEAAAVSWWEQYVAHAEHHGYATAAGRMLLQTASGYFGAA